MLLAGEPFLEELLVPQMVQSLGSCCRVKPNLGGQPLKAALRGNALGKAAASGFTVCVFPPHKSRGQLKIKQKAEGWKSGPGRGSVWEKGTLWTSDILAVS